MQKFVEACSVHDTVCYTIHLWRNSDTLITHGISAHSAEYMLGGDAFGAVQSLSQLLFHSLVKLL